MNIFASLRRLFGPKRDHQEVKAPWQDLTTAQKRALSRLCEDEDFAIFLDALTKGLSFYGETLISPRCENAEFYRGMIAGIREAAKLPRTVAQMEEIQENARERATADGADAQRRRAFATYGSPAWTRRFGNGSD